MLGSSWRLTVPSLPLPLALWKPSRRNLLSGNWLHPDFRCWRRCQKLSKLETSPGSLQLAPMMAMGSGTDLAEAEVVWISAIADPPHDSESLLVDWELIAIGRVFAIVSSLREGKREN